MSKAKEAPIEPGTAVGQPTAKTVAQYREDEGAGFEGMTQKDFLIPFVGVLQKMSPEVDADADSHIEGAKAGMFFNTSTLDLFDGEKGIRFIPVHRDHKYVEWVPRESGGGFVATHEPESPEVNKAREEAGTDFGKLALGDNDLIETFYVFGLMVDDNDLTTPAVLAFKSTGIKSYRAWMTKARGIKLKDPTDGHSYIAPMFAHVYKLTTFLDENKKGKFHSIRVMFDGPNAEACRLPEDHPLYIEAKGVRELVVSGVAKVDMEKSAASAEEVDESKKPF